MTDSSTTSRTSTDQVAGPVDPTDHAAVRLRPIPLGSAKIASGFWAERQQVNADKTIPIGSTRLREAGNLANLRLAARELATPSPTPPGRDAYRGPLFMDSDVYKWLEAVAWEYARSPRPELLAELTTFTEAISAAQAPDGYVNSFVQVTRGGADRYADLAMGHELYCLGHLIQAAVAARRATGDTKLWDVARHAADHLVETFGPDGNTGLDGHPVIEMALVELYRESQDRRYLELAEHFVSTRGNGTVHGHGREPVYYSDRVPVRQTTSPEGHAVRAVYLAAGAADVAAETGDAELDGALQHQFDEMVAAKQYLTGGLGSRWDGEAFGDPFELPPDVAYAETCAAIGAVQWAWRELLTTGDVRFADQIERMLFNGFISGVSLTGDEFFYVNALQVRADAVPDDHRQPVNGRQGWFHTACCPPNVMRTLAQLAGYLATADDSGLQLHQYAASSVRSGERNVQVETDYPWDGTVTVTVTATDADEWTLSLRVPEWCEEATVSVAGGASEPVSPGYATVRRRWQSGDQVALVLPMPVRLTAGASRVDAVRGCLAVERGPLVYAVEQVDQPDSRAVDDLCLAGTDPADLRAELRRDLFDGTVVVRGPARGADGSPYEFTAIPYCRWANREVGPMRVWLPVAEQSR
ncbi:MAG: glycoside hydrolase family 127 protein [Jatrophihabitans sp.]